MDGVEKGFCTAANYMVMDPDVVDDDDELGAVLPLNLH